MGGRSGQDVFYDPHRSFARALVRFGDDGNLGTLFDVFPFLAVHFFLDPRFLPDLLDFSAFFSA